MAPSRRRPYLIHVATGDSQGSVQQRLQDDVELQQPNQALLLPGASLSPLRQRLLMLCILVGFFFSLLDTTIVSTSLLAVSDDLKDFRNGSWVVLAYLLTYMGFSTVCAKLSDIYGRRAILLSSWIIFATTSVACGCSISMTQLVICRAFQGIGGAGLYSLTTIALPEIGPADKPHVIGPLIAMTLSLSFVLGPILGGLIPQFATWRLIYWINCPFCLVTTAGLAFLYPNEAGSLRQGASLRRVDFLGSILLLAATVLLVFALQQAGSLTFAWNSTPIMVSLVTAAISFVLLCAWETWLSLGNKQVEPIFPTRLGGNRVYIASLVTMFLVGYVYLSLILALPERFQIANGDNFWTAGFHLFPMLGGTAVGCFINGPINARKNRTSIVAVISCIFIFASTSLFNTLKHADTDMKAQYGYQVIFGLGVGLFFSAATIMGTAQAHRRDHAVAQGAIAQARVLGGAIGLAVATIILNDRVQRELIGKLTHTQLNALHQSPIALIQKWPELQALIRETYSASFATMIQVMTVVSGMALLGSICTMERNPPPVHGELTSNKDVIPSRGNSEVELDDRASDRSIVAFVEPTVPQRTLAPQSRIQREVELELSK